MKFFPNKCILKRLLFAPVLFFFLRLHIIFGKHLRDVQLAARGSCAARQYFFAARQSILPLSNTDVTAFFLLKRGGESDR
jgi:hypothetical protein